MLKFVLVLASLFAIANCQLGGVGGWMDQPNVPTEVIDLAKWAIVNINKGELNNGEHNLANIRNVRTQVVAGMNYRFTMDTLFIAFDGTTSGKSCDVAIFSQPWSNTIRFIEEPRCN